MKKFFVLLLTLAMVFAMTACGESAEPTPAPVEGGEPAATKVAVFWYNFGDAFLSTVRDALDADLTKAGVEFQNFDGATDQSTQLEQIQTAVTNGFNILVVNVVSSGSADIAEQIIDAANGLPVIFFNRAIEGDGEDGKVLNAHSNIAFIGTDAPEAGHMQGKMIGDFLVANYDEVDLNGDGVISYAMFMGDANNVEAIYRTRYGVEDANAVLTANGYPELEYFNANSSEKYQLDPNGAWSSAAGNEFMTTNLAEYSEANGNMIELVIANNDDMALGAMAALQSAGYNNNDGGKTIPVFGVDATQPARDAIAAGGMTGTVLQSATAMADAICSTVVAVAGDAAPADAVAGLASGDGLSLAAGFTNKLYVAYQPVA
ncbi:MAG: galactose ABC transporter substrate-binding protein [Oscillospiraceae bacterium]|nr:galactose ABC transporter substrate-binding protein [Oscillospiraceae bacterium]